METTIQLPDGKQVTLQHDGELTDDAIRNAVSQLGYKVGDGSDSGEMLKNLGGEGIRLTGALGGALLGSRVGMAGRGGMLGAALAEPLASLLTPRKESTGEHLANILTAGILPEAEAGGLAARLLSGAKTGAAIGGAYKGIENIANQGNLGQVSDYVAPVAGGAAIGSTLEGLLGPRLAANVPEAAPATPPPAPTPPPPATKELPITAALSQHKASNLQESNAKANAIATSGSTPPEAVAQATPAPTPTEAPVRVSTDDEDAIEAALGKTVNPETGLTKEAEDKLLAEQQAQIEALRNKGATEAEIKAAADKFEVPPMGLEKPKEFLEVYKDEDGYWGNLPDGWEIDGSTGIREDTKKKLLSRLKDAQPAKPEQSKPLIDTEAEIKAAADKFEMPPMGIEKPETIQAAAVKFSDGEVRTGKNHAEIIHGIPEDDLRGSDDGFVTSTGRYVDREEGMKIAKASGQVEGNVERPNLAMELINEKPLPPETVFTKQNLGGKTVTQIDIPNPEGGRPLFSGSIADAIDAGYKFNLPNKIPEGKTTFEDLTALRQREGKAAAAPAAAKGMPLEAIGSSGPAKTPIAPETPVAASGMPAKGTPPPPVEPPGIPLRNFGEEPDFKVRGYAKNAIDADFIPEEVRNAIKEDPAIMYQRHEFGDWVDQAEASTMDELRQRIADAKSTDEAIIYKKELSNRLIAEKKYDEAAKVFVGQAESMTPAAQTLSAARMIRTAFGDLADVEQTAFKAGRTMTEEQRTKVLDLSSKEIQAQKAVNVAERRAKEFYSDENMAAYNKAMKDLGEAKREFGEFIDQVTPRDFADMAVKIIQGNLMTPISLAANITGNAIFGPLQRASMSAATAIDALTTGSMKAIGRLTGASAEAMERLGERSISAANPLPSAKEIQAANKAMWIAAKEILTGPSHESYVKMEVFKGFRPMNALMDSITGANLPLTEAGNVARWDRTKAFIEATAGVPPEVMFRMLNIGDKPFRRAAEVRALLEQARLKGVSDENLDKFLAFPDARSKAIADQAGHRAVFSEENVGITGLNKFLDSDMAKLLRIDKIPLLAGAMKVFGRLTVPFRQFPINYALTAMNYAVPPLAMSRASYYGYKSFSVMSDKSLSVAARAAQSLEFRRKANINLGEALMGTMMYAAADVLWRNGLISESPGQTAADRSIQSQRMGAAKLNVDGLERLTNGQDPSYRVGDKTVEWTRLGIPAVVFHIYTQKAVSDQTKSAKLGEQSAPADFSSPKELLKFTYSAAPGIGSFVFDQSFLAGTSSLLEAIKNPDPDSPVFQNWLQNMFRATTALAIPSTVETVARTRMDYTPEIRGGDLPETLGNIWKFKTLQLPQTDQDMVYKRDTWGEKIPRIPEGANRWAYNLVDVSKYGGLKQDAHDQALYDLYQRTKQPSVYPDPVGRTYTMPNGDTLELTPAYVEKLQEVVGRQRRLAMETMTDSDMFRRLDPFEKVFALEKAYEQANTTGNKLFLAQSGIWQDQQLEKPQNKVVSRSTKGDLIQRLGKP